MAGSSPDKNTPVAEAMSAPITENTTLLAAPRASKEQARAYIVKLGSTAYTDQDINLIVNHYWKHAVPVGLDPLLAVAQCIHETSFEGHPISSWWAQRPRRNPAGLGVTGRVRKTAPPDPKNWAVDTTNNPTVWRAGLSFNSWEEAVRAQLGRLLAYALPEGKGTSEQKALIAFALSIRPLGSALRGSAPTLKPLGAKHNRTGTGWASPGIQYGARIAAKAEAIRKMPG